VNFGRLPRTKVSINLTPLIDVVFLMLIFFTVSSRFSELTQLTVNLPEAQGYAESIDKVLLLTVDANGQMRLNGQPVPGGAVGLGEAVRRKINDNSDMPMTLSANAMTPHHYVVTALEVAAQLNLKQLTLATQPVSERGML